jgi:molybdenum cofactor cytidylyltransferase
MPKRISAIVLAAGSARLREQPKVLLPLDQKPMIHHVVEQLARTSVSEIIVVAGGSAEAVRSALAPTRAKVVENPNAADGVGTSVRKGIEHSDPQADGFLIIPGDMPLVSSALISRFLAEFESHRDGILLPAYQNVPGYPVIFDRRFRSRLSSLAATESASAVWMENPREVFDTHVLTDAVVFDVDSDADYEEIHRRLGAAPPAA